MSTLIPIFPTRFDSKDLKIAESMPLGHVTAAAYHRRKMRSAIYDYADMPDEFDFEEYSYFMGYAPDPLMEMND